MSIGESLNSSYHAARAPWSDAPRGTLYPSQIAQLRRNPQDDRYDAAAKELREALADGEWHPIADLHAVAKRHKVSPTLLADRAAVYIEAGSCVWTWAFLEREHHDGRQM